MAAARAGRKPLRRLIAAKIPLDGAVDHGVERGDLPPRSDHKRAWSFKGNRRGRIPGRATRKRKQRARTMEPTARAGT